MRFFRSTMWRLFSSDNALSSAVGLVVKARRTFGHAGQSSSTVSSSSPHSCSSSMRAPSTALLQYCSRSNCLSAAAACNASSAAVFSFPFSPRLPACPAAGECFSLQPSAEEAGCGSAAALKAAAFTPAAAAVEERSLRSSRSMCSSPRVCRFLKNPSQQHLPLCRGATRAPLHLFLQQQEQFAAAASPGVPAAAPAVRSSKRPAASSPRRRRRSRGIGKGVTAAPASCWKNRQAAAATAADVCSTTIEAVLVGKRTPPTAAAVSSFAAAAPVSDAVAGAVGRLSVFPAAAQSEAIQQGSSLISVGSGATPTPKYDSSLKSRTDTTATESPSECPAAPANCAAVTDQRETRNGCATGSAAVEEVAAAPTATLSAFIEGRDVCLQDEKRTAASSGVQTPAGTHEVAAATAIVPAEDKTSAVLAAATLLPERIATSTFSDVPATGLTFLPSAKISAIDQTSTSSTAPLAAIAAAAAVPERSQSRAWPLPMQPPHQLHQQSKQQQQRNEQQQQGERQQRKDQQRGGKKQQQQGKKQQQQEGNKHQQERKKEQQQQHLSSLESVSPVASWSFAKFPSSMAVAAAAAVGDPIAWRCESAADIDAAAVDYGVIADSAAATASHAAALPRLPAGTEATWPHAVLPQEAAAAAAAGRPRRLSAAKKIIRAVAVLPEERPQWKQRGRQQQQLKKKELQQQQVQQEHRHLADGRHCDTAVQTPPPGAAGFMRKNETLCEVLPTAAVLSVVSSSLLPSFHPVASSLFAPSSPAVPVGCNSTTVTRTAAAAAVLPLSGAEPAPLQLLTETAELIETEMGSAGWNEAAAGTAATAATAAAPVLAGAATAPAAPGQAAAAETAAGKELVVYTAAAAATRAEGNPASAAGKRGERDATVCCSIFNYRTSSSDIEPDAALSFSAVHFINSTRANRTRASFSLESSSSSDRSSSGSSSSGSSSSGSSSGSSGSSSGSSGSSSGSSGSSSGSSGSSSGSSSSSGSGEFVEDGERGVRSAAADGTARSSSSGRDAPAAGGGSIRVSAEAEKAKGEYVQSSVLPAEAGRRAAAAGVSHCSDVTGTIVCPSSSFQGVCAAETSSAVQENAAAAAGSAAGGRKAAGGAAGGAAIATTPLPSSAAREPGPTPRSGTAFNANVERKRTPERQAEPAAEATAAAAAAKTGLTAGLATARQAAAAAETRTAAAPATAGGPAAEAAVLAAAAGLPAAAEPPGTAAGKGPGAAGKESGVAGKVSGATGTSGGEGSTTSVITPVIFTADSDTGVSDATLGPRSSSMYLTPPMCPRDMVNYLDKYIIGQEDAKKAVAVALRQRWRRRQIDDDKLREDITPKNILLIGPTGVGKTEVARRLARRIDAPFIKVEATKFTEVGFHGRDVDQIVKDLVEVAVKNQRSRLQEAMRPAAEQRAESKILEALLGKVPAEEQQHWLRHLRCGALDARRVHIELPRACSSSNSSSSHGSSSPSEAYPPHRDSLLADLENLLRDIDRPPRSTAFFAPLTRSSRLAGEARHLTVKEARKKLMQAELDMMVTKDLVVQKALESVEQEGIVFVDEIDKICTRGGRGGGYNPDASDEGVQRDLLPLIEGTTVSTRYGDVKTDYILFIASGAFHCVKPSDMLAELQGRLPIRVTLKPLSEQDLRDILTKTKSNLIEQNVALLKTENVDLHFTQEAIHEVARVACEVNANVENIGARRLHTIIEKIMEDVNFTASSLPPGTRVEIDLQRVKDSVSSLLTRLDHSRFVL